MYKLGQGLRIRYCFVHRPRAARLAAARVRIKSTGSCKWAGVICGCKLNFGTTNVGKTAARKRANLACAPKAACKDRLIA